MTYVYTDEGNHQMWTTAHQGGTYSRVSRVHRLFLGSGPLFAAIGSDSFRQDAQIAYNNDAPIGTQLEGLDQVGQGSFISTIGIVEDENHGCGRYFFMRYDDTGSVLKPTTVMVYDSLYTDEVAASSTAEAWAPFVDLGDHVESGMRVVNLGGGPNRTFLFYIVPLPGRKTRLNVVQMPDPGDPVSTAAPLTIADFDFEVIDRVYAIPHKDGKVFLYLGDSDRSRDRRTQVVGYSPLEDKVFLTPTLVASDQVPFPASYAGCVGREVYGELPIHLVLEPLTSWLQGAGASIDDSPDVQNMQPPSTRRSTGNAWKMTSIGPGGVVIEDSATFTGDDIKPWMGAAHSDSQGGQMRVSAVPKMLARIAPPPDSYAANKSVPDVDNSDAYATQAKVVVRQEGTLTESAFVYRRDMVSDDLRPTFSNNRGTSNVTENAPPDIGSGEGSANRSLMGLLVPGTIMIESQRSEPLQTDPTLRTVGSVAARLRSWDLQDNSTFYGFPVASLEGGDAIAGQTAQDPSTDCIHGVQGDVFDPDLTIVVGWYVNGYAPAP